MKQAQVGVHPLLSVTVMAGVLGLAGYVQACGARRDDRTDWIHTGH
jgi:hypothetical protein